MLETEGSCRAMFLWIPHPHTFGMTTQVDSSRVRGCFHRGAILAQGPEAQIGFVDVWQHV